eukprot:scaffold125737_cov17-Prasinocladus_malaysianus.AAC.1
MVGLAIEGPSAELGLLPETSAAAAKPSPGRLPQSPWTVVFEDTPELEVAVKGQQPSPERRTPPESPVDWKVSP